MAYSQQTMQQILAIINDPKHAQAMRRLGEEGDRLLRNAIAGPTTGTVASDGVDAAALTFSGLKGIVDTFGAAKPDPWHEDFLSLFKPPKLEPERYRPVQYMWGLDLARPGGDHSAIAMLITMEDGSRRIGQVMDVVRGDYAAMARRAEFLLLRPAGMSWAHWRKVHRERKRRAQMVLEGPRTKPERCERCGQRVPLLERYTHEGRIFCRPHYELAVGQS